MNNPVKFVYPDGREWVAPQEATELREKVVRKKAMAMLDYINAVVLNGGSTGGKELKDKVDRIYFLDMSIKNIDRLGEDKNHAYDLVGNMGGSAHHVTLHPYKGYKKGDETKKGVINITGTGDGMLLHEIEHVAFSLIRGGLEFSGGFLMTKNQVREEKRAYKTQRAFTSQMPLKADFISDINLGYIANIKTDSGDFAYENAREEFMKEQRKLGKEARAKKRREKKKK